MRHHRKCGLRIEPPLNNLNIVWVGGSGGSRLDACGCGVRGTQTKDAGDSHPRRALWRMVVWRLVSLGLAILRCSSEASRTGNEEENGGHEESVHGPRLDQGRPHRR